MLNITVKNNDILENKKSKTLLYTIATLVILTMSSGSKSIYAMNMTTKGKKINMIRDVKRGKSYTKEEDKIIEDGMINNLCIEEIAELLPVRRSIKSIKGHISDFKRRKFSKEEDISLTSLVKKYGKNNWEKVASELPGRTPKVARDRWTDHLSTYTNKRNKYHCYTKEEDDTIIRKFEEFGYKWNTIANYLPGLTVGQVKSRWYNSERRKKSDKSIEPEIQQLPQQPNQDFIQSAPVTNDDQNNPILSSEPNGRFPVLPDIPLSSDDSFNPTNIIYLLK